MNSENTLIDSDFISKKEMDNSKKWKILIVVHLFLFASGLYYINKSLKRSWVYSALSFYAWIAYINVFVIVFPELERFNNHSLFGALTIIVSWAIAYLVGGLDAYFTLRRIKKDT